jgi:ATP-dependent DNA ligase
LCGDLQKLARQISKSADYSDEGSGCEKLSHWQTMDVRAEVDGFRCLVFRDHENIFLQSKAGKSLSSAFPEIVEAFRALRPKHFVLDGELALSTEHGFSFDGLVNRLRVTGPRIARAAQESPAIYIVFDMLADAASLLDLPFRLRRKTLEQFFRSHVKQSSPLYLSASTADLSEVEKWIGHVGQQLDGIIAKPAEAPYRPGDDHCMVKIKNYRSADCVVGGFRDKSIGSTRNELLLGFYNSEGKLHYVGTTSIDAKQRQAVGNLTSGTTVILMPNCSTSIATDSERPSTPNFVAP